MMKITALLCLSLVLTTGAQNATSFEGCALNSYYASILADFGTAPTTWGQENVRSLIQNTHRNILPNTATIAGGDDILTALIDLDRGTSNDTVRLLYRNINFPSLPAGDRNSWSREDLWPIERGATRESPALTDVHSKKPADSSVLLKKDRLFFGICGTVENEGACSRPATTETADDTEQDSKIFAPPASFRGDVARSLFYTALRYEEQLGLRLTDCPPFRDGEFGYLSMLLKWHEEDRVSPEEQARNNRACERWQGNRNPFVDYPELVTQYFGQPDTIVDGTRTYSQCTTPTNAPTADPNECSDLKPGDIPVFVLNSDDPDQVVFYPLADIPASIGELYVTDDAWTGTGFQGIEGTITFNVPEEGIKAGQSFGYGKGSPFSDRWQEDPSGLFSLGINGDQIFIYCRNADDLPNFIGGFSYNGNWSNVGLADYGTDKSALPESLQEVGSIALPHADNCLYTGQIAGRKSELLASYENSENWSCENAVRYEIDLSSRGFTVTSLLSLCIAIISLSFTY